MSSLPQARRRNVLLAAYIAAVVAVATGGTVIALFELGPIAFETQWNWPMLIGMTVVAAVVERARIDLFGESKVSLTFVPVLGAALLLGPAPAALAGCVATFSAQIADRKPWYKLLFNMAVVATSTIAAGATFHGLVGTPDVETLVPDAAVAVLASLVAFLANSSLVVGVIAISSSRSPFAVWTEKFRWLAPHYVALGLTSYALAIGYIAVGVAGVIIFALPVAMLWLAVRQYAARARNDVIRVRDSERWFRSLLETSPVGIAVVGQEARAWSFNLALCEMLGYAREELERVTVERALQSGGDDDLESWMRSRLDDGETVTRIQSKLVRRDGQLIDVDISASVVRQRDDEVSLLLEIRDITEELGLKRRLLVAQKSEALGSLVAGVAHDFNNLLTAISLGIKLARTQPSRQSEPLRDAEIATDRATQLVRQLLQYSRHAEPQREPVALSELVQETIGMARETFDRRITVELDESADVPAVMADAGQMQQVLMNLLLNARDAVMERARQAEPGNDYRPHIRVSVLADEPARPGEDGPAQRVLISIFDDGTGIPSDLHERIFDPFFTTKAIGMGTGLGLSTAYGIVTGHGGTIEVQSEPGRGTTFTVALPAAEAYIASDGEDDQSSPSRPLPDGSTSGAVLLVDDEPQVLALTGMILENAGYDVTTASSGSDAVRAAAARSYDLAVLDVNMPSPNGWETLRELHRLTPGTPVLMSSGYVTATEVRERGAQGLIEKPYTLDELLLAVQEVIERQRQGASAPAERA